MRASTLRVFTSSALTVGLLAVGATAASAHETYEVQPGDTLSAIAHELDAVDTWRQLADANAHKLPDPNLIFPGQVLQLTPGEAAQAASTPAASSAPAETTTTETTTTESTSSTTTTTTSSTTDAGVWDRLAQCESSGNWSINTGNGYYGGLQFALSSWEWVGGTGYPHEASKAEQIARAEILLERQGWNAWPSCSRQLGLR
jgi:LysM repeat protein